MDHESAKWLGHDFEPCADLRALRYWLSLYSQRSEAERERWRQFQRGETIPSVANTAPKMIPYLELLCDQGWPGLSERDRGDMTNLLADLRVAVKRTVR